MGDEALTMIWVNGIGSLLALTSRWWGDRSALQTILVLMAIVNFGIVLDNRRRLRLATERDIHALKQADIEKEKGAPLRKPL